MVVQEVRSLFFGTGNNGRRRRGTVLRALVLTVLCSLSFPYTVCANHVFFPVGTDYWHVNPMSGPKYFGRQGNWVREADGREHYYVDGVLQKNIITMDNWYVDENGCRGKHTNIEEYDMVTESRGKRVIIVSKSGHRLEIWRDGKRTHWFTVSSGKNEGDKEVLGDGKTPVGEFYITNKKGDSFAYLALELSYPNAEDAERGLHAGIISQGQYQQIVNAVQTGGIPSGDTRLGGAIQIHGARKFAGDDSSRGCVEMLSQDMEIAYNCMELGDKVIILP